MTVSSIRPKQGTLGVWTVLGVLVILAALFVGIRFRTGIVSAAPSSAALFKALGLSANPLEADIRSVTARMESKGTERNLVIEGEIINLKSSTNIIPDIKLSVIDESGSVIFSWIAPLPTRSLKGHENLRFRANLASPPAGNRRVSVAFSG